MMEYQPGWGLPKWQSRRFCSIKCRPPSFAGKRHTDDAKAAISAGHIGVNAGVENYRWKGDQAGYGAIHQWVNKRYPKTGRCEWCGAARDKTQWHSISGEYLREDREDWAELCPGCNTRAEKATRRCPHCNELLYGDGPKPKIQQRTFARSRGLT